jgi:hypothetical protein
MALLRCGLVAVVMTVLLSGASERVEALPASAAPPSPIP